MDLSEIMEAVNHLSTEEREQLKTYLSEPFSESQPHTLEEWLAEFEDIAKEFRGDSSDEEMREIVEAMRLKSPPSEKGL